MKKRHFMMMLCALLVGGTMFSCASESGTDTPPEIEVNEGDVVAMTVSPASLNLDAGGSKTITVTYKKNNKGVAGGHISAKSNNINCFVINSETKSDYTDANGEFEVIVEAKNVTEDCDGTVEITDLDGRVESRFVNISVTSTAGGGGGGGGGTPTGDPELIVLEPSNEQITLNKKGEKANIVVEYRNAKGKTQADTTIEIQNSKDSCIKPAFGDITTGSNGQATLPITAVGENCTSFITLTVGDVSEEVAVTVGEADEYFRTLKINYLNTGDHNPANIGMRHNDVSQLIYGFGMDETCPSYEDLLDRPQLRQVKTATSFRQTNPIVTQKLELSRNKSPYSIIAYAENSAGDLLAVGCVDGVGPDTESTCNECKGGKCNDVCLPIYEIPILFGDVYEVTTNFDLFSRFEQTHKHYKAEEMTAGDWVQFIIAFCRDPFGRLVDFVWDNSVSRLADIITVEWLKFIFAEGTRDLARNALKDTLGPTLEAQTWYKVINQVAPDIADLASNMQLKGYFEMGTYKDLKMSNMKVTFDRLEYQWSLEFVGQESCIDGAYGNSKCRRKMPLTTQNSMTIEGSCGATVELSSDPGIDGYMEFSVSNLTFKWATILYSAIFREILPSALGYSDNTNLTRGRYISAFLESVLFSLLINHYNENLRGKPKVDDEGNTQTYPTLAATTPCSQFIEVLIYLISLKAAGMSNTIAGFADMICGDGIMGQLDTLIEGAFNKIEAKTSQGLTMATTDCPLYSEDNVYKQIGKPDAGATVPTANEVFGSTKPKETNRCKWNVSIGSFAFDGIFHAEENSL